MRHQNAASRGWDEVTSPARLMDMCVKDPDNDFDRHAHPEEDLWAIMEKVLAVSVFNVMATDDDIPF